MHDFQPTSTHGGVCATCNRTRQQHDEDERFSRLEAKLDLIQRGLAHLVAAIGQQPIELTKMAKIAEELGYERPSTLVVGM